MMNPPVRSLIQCVALVACQLAESSPAVAQSAPHAAPPRHGAFPKVSPDGRQVLFARDSVGQLFLYVMNADGSHQRPVPGGFMPLSWFPDGKRLLVGIPGEGRGAPIRLASVTLDGADLKEISTGGVSVMGGARLLGDAKTILFGAAGRDSAGRQTLGVNVLELASARARQVTMPNVNGRLLAPPEPSPDGRRYIDELPSWSPKGYIYFQSDRDGPMEIYRMKPDGSGQERITGRTPDK